MSRSDQVRAMLDGAMAHAEPHGPAAEPASTPRDPVRVGSVVLGVRDLPAVETFYRDVVGLQTVSGGGDTVSLGAGGKVLLTLQHRPDALPDAPGSAGLFHTAFLLPSRADLGAWLWRTGRHGQKLDGAADHLVSEAMYLHDPEGNGVEVYADRPRNQWTWRDGQVAMANRNPDFDAILQSASQEWMGAPPGTRVGHVHLRVGDIGAARTFYTRALGLDVVGDGDSAVFMSSGGYHHHIACNVWSSAGAGPRDPGQAGLLAVLMEADGAEPRMLHDPWGTVVEVASA